MIRQSECSIVFALWVYLLIYILQEGNPKWWSSRLWAKIASEPIKYRIYLFISRLPCCYLLFHSLYYLSTVYVNCIKLNLFHKLHTYFPSFINLLTYHSLYSVSSSRVHRYIKNTMIVFSRCCFVICSYNISSRWVN